MKDQPMKPSRMFGVADWESIDEKARREAAAEEEVQSETVVWQWQENGEPSPAK